MGTQRSARVLILCDFDGTVCSVDMGNEILNRFTGKGWEEIDRAYCADEIGSRVAYSQVTPLFKGTRSQMLKFVSDKEKLDPYFAGFYVYCREKGVDLKIVSDGLDFYIDAILKKYGLGEIEYFSNAVLFSDRDKMSIEFPQMNKKCEKCGTCKSNILTKYQTSYDMIVYIGDGHSDFCPAQKADLVFAKGILYEKCMEVGKSTIQYGNFQDVHQYFENHFFHGNVG